jgi:flagellin
MGMSVNTNVAALNSYRNLGVTNDQMSKSLERLSSGFRINRAADDAAGLAISEGLRSQIGGMKQAVRNTQDGISVVQTAEGALGTTTSILQRMRDLSVQAENSGSLNDDAKKSIQKEIGELKSELSRIAQTTNFNGTKLLDGSFTGKSFQVGANASEAIQVNIATAMGAAGLNVDGVDVTAEGDYAFVTGTTAAAGQAAVTTAAGAAAASVLTITSKDATEETPNADLLFFQNLSGTISFGGKSLDLGGVDYSDADNDGNSSTNPTAAQALTALNKAAKEAFGLENDPFAATATALTFTVTEEVEGYTAASGYAKTASAGDLAKATATFDAATGSKQAIKDIDAAIKTVSSIRADLGAKQNRFEHTINNLNVAIENTTASESRIRDTDMAQEMTNFTRTQILTQAGTSMLAQANQASQGILRLLG